MAITVDEANTKGPYYASAGKVWKHPIERRNDDGSRTISLGFPVCTMHECVGDESAEAVANLMNAGHLAKGEKEE